jgi:hypothetical protein
MKKLSVLFLILGSFLTWSSGFAMTDGDRMRAGSADLTFEKGGQSNQKCTDLPYMSECTTTGSQVGRCIGKDCTPYVCQKGYWLFFTNKDSEMPPGLCLNEKQAKAKCKEQLDKNPNLAAACGAEDLVPVRAQNPYKEKYNWQQANKGFKFTPKLEKLLKLLDDAYADWDNNFSECACDKVLELKYECGDGTGTPPAQESFYSDQEIEFSENESCEKTGAKFKEWLCTLFSVADATQLRKPKAYKPGESIQNIHGNMDCVAQYEWNKYTVTFSCGDGATGSVASQEIVYNKPVKMPNVSECSKLGYTLTGWKTGSTDIGINDSVTITDDTEIIAQWEKCPDCTPGDGCDCEVTVENNQCKYITKPKNGFALISGGGTQNPQCISMGQQECKDSGGKWDNGKCKCDPDVPGTHWDIGLKQCICDDENLEFKNNRCVEPCPDGTTGEEMPDCQCNETGKIFSPGTKRCDCPNDKPLYKDGECTAPAPNAKEYTIIFDCNDGDLPKKTELKFYENVELVIVDMNCTRTGYILSGWSSNELQMSVGLDSVYKVTKNVTFTPEWVEEQKKEKYKISYECGPGTTGEPPVDDVEYNAGATVTVKDSGTCAKPGEDFDVWICANNGSFEFDDTFSITSNVTCVARWKKACPSEAPGNYPECKCNDENREFNKETEKCDCKDGFKEDENGKCINKLDELKETYEDAKANEQSLANRTLTAATIAATGIGAKELAQGLAEQRADKIAEQDMSAYIATFRCEYGNGKQVKGGPDEIELPGGNDANMMKYRSEYMALAADLKERKLALGMKAGIESEEILDKSKMGLYDDENIGIESGAYASLYRAQMLGSEEDQAKLDEEAKKSKARVIGGGTAFGVGVVGGIVGNSLINGKLGDKIKENKEIKTTQNGMSPLPAKQDKCTKACNLTNQAKREKHVKKFNCTCSE